jgi:drug/metabolite transporter (DMT)-like permease
MKIHQQLFGAGSIIIATIFFASFSVLARIIGFSLPFYYQSIIREGIASCIIFFIICLRKIPLKQMTPESFFWVLLRAFMGSFAFILFYYCVNAIPIGTTYFLFYGSSTIVGYFLGKALFHEHLTSTKIISIIIAIIGLMLIYSINFNSIPFVYMVMAFTTGIANAFWYIIPKKIGNYPTIQLALMDNLLPIPIYIIISFVLKETWTLPIWSAAWIANATYGLLFVFTGQLVIYGMKRIEAQIGTLLMLGEIPGAIILGYAFYQEQVTFATAIGGTLIVLAMIIPEISLFIKNKRILDS